MFSQPEPKQVQSLQNLPVQVIRLETESWFAQDDIVEQRFKKPGGEFMDACHDAIWSGISYDVTFPRMVKQHGEETCLLLSERNDPETLTMARAAYGEIVVKTSVGHEVTSEHNPLNYGKLKPIEVQLTALLKGIMREETLVTHWQLRWSFGKGSVYFHLFLTVRIAKQTKLDEKGQKLHLPKEGFVELGMHVASVLSEPALPDGTGEASSNEDQPAINKELFKSLGLFKQIKERDPTNL